jgi:hypothetical protein
MGEENRHHIIGKWTHLPMMGGGGVRDIGRLKENENFSFSLSANIRPPSAKLQKKEQLFTFIHITAEDENQLSSLDEKDAVKR